MNTKLISIGETEINTELNPFWKTEMNIEDFQSEGQKWISYIELISIWEKELNWHRTNFNMRDRIKLT